MVANISQKSERTISQRTECEVLPISVVVVSYNSRELLRACLASTASEGANEVIVIDNASSDGSAEMVADEFPWIRMLRSEQNDGYGAAANLAIASCSAKYVLLLNCDTLLHPGTLQALCEYLDQHPEVAIVGPALVNPDGTPQASCFPFPTPLHTLLRETSLSSVWNGSVSNRSPRFAGAVPWVLGAALAIRRHAFESVGGFDRSFFMYFEEVDLCYRLSRAGWQTHFAPSATVTHVGGASTKPLRLAMLSQLYESLCHFYQLHYSRVQSFQLKLVLTYVMLRNMIKQTFKIIPRMLAHESHPPTDDLRAWRMMLSNVWSRHGWLQRP